jgi:ABC-type amino acid transport substrate-binding protein
VREPTLHSQRPKKKNSENIKNITNQGIEQLMEALKAGKSEALTNYLAAVAKFHPYSFQNILLIESDSAPFRGC